MSTPTTITLSVSVSVAELSKHTGVSERWIKKNEALISDYFQGYFMLSVKCEDYDGEIAEHDRLLKQAVTACVEGREDEEKKERDAEKK